MFLTILVSVAILVGTSAVDEPPARPPERDTAAVTGKASQGWVMARDLAVGDSLWTLRGFVRVARIEEGPVVPVFNLDIATDADFFDGHSAALLHDNTLPDLRQRPLDDLGFHSARLEPGSKTANRPFPLSGSSRP